MSAPYARFFTPPLHGGSFPLPRARDVVKTSVFTRPRKRDSSNYTAPESAGVCEVTATSVLDASMSGTAQVSATGAGGVTAADDADDGACTWDHCSFREAINEANAEADSDTIYLSPAAAPSPARAPGKGRAEGPAHITTVLTSALPTITTDLAIIGEGSTSMETSR